MNTTRLVKISVLALLSYVLMLFELALPIFPGFLKIDIGDLPAILGAMLMGPVSGIFIELIKNLLHLIIQTSSAGIGELANFIVGIAFVVPIGIIFRRNQSIKGYLYGALAGCICMVLVAGFVNYFFLIPAYARIFGRTVQDFVVIAGNINKAVVDLRTLVLFAIVPFNVLKAVILLVVGYLMYKPLKFLFNKFGER